jgi:hypothetical protein
MAVPIDITARVGEVVATLGYLPPALAAALRTRFADYVAHHKLAVVKRAGEKFEAKDRARRMVASRMFGYGSRKRDSLMLEDVNGESFFASRDGVAQLSRDAILTMEKGGRVVGSGLMAIPIGQGPGTGRPFSGVFANRAVWTGKGNKSLLDPKKYAVVKGPNGALLIVKKAKGRRGGADGAEAPVVGVLLPSRDAKARLGFYDEAKRIAPRHAAKVDADVELAMTEAGRAALQEKDRVDKAAKEGASAAFRQFLDRNPGKFARARAVGAAASRVVRARNKVRG